MRNVCVDVAEANAHDQMKQIATTTLRIEAAPEGMAVGETARVAGYYGSPFTARTLVSPWHGQRVLVR